ncbi:conserved transmembrane protein [Mycolicibacterium aurum]|uniref:Conserved transmembrane protein n=1 Tax=Mycolicibacterium aurum TaxID=1791 RepID=A0A448IGI0_MYCAU|nr:hypothetical protein [Mycolicibacterium aurum]VEG51582.1 conserved transmembrane protein [Mycolicibacterium aurum]
MTGSDDSTSSTRPISVAELLAKNGSIGAPPVGGRRRRRRGNADAVTVAELTGEIPIIRPDAPPPPPVTAAPVEVPVEEPEPAAETPAEPEDAADVSDAEIADVPEAEIAEAEIAEADSEVPVSTEDAVTDVESDEPAEAAESAELEEPAAVPPAEVDATAADEDDEYADAVAEFAARRQEQGTDTELDAEPADERPARRFGLGRLGRKGPAVDAEKWTPDPVDDGGAATEVGDVVDPIEIEELDDERALATDIDSATDADDSATDTDTDTDDDRDELPSYLRSTEEPLFGGQTVADDLARRGTRTSPVDTDDDEDEDEDEAPGYGEDGEPRRMSSVVHGAWIVGQSIVAVVFGAGLFVAFDQLWKWNNIVALVLSVLVILGLVVGVRVVRKTEDIGSTLIAVAVGALVTLGPLALLQSG